MILFLIELAYILELNIFTFFALKSIFPTVFILCGCAIWLTFVLPCVFSILIVLNAGLILTFLAVNCIPPLPAKMFVPINYN